MTNGWYFHKDGEQTGPFTMAQLQEKVNSGSIQAKDLVWKEGMEEWVSAETVPGLFPGAGTPPPPASTYSDPGSSQVPNDSKQETHLAGWLTGIIVKPGKTFTDIARSKPITLAIGLYVVVSVLFFISYEMVDPTTVFRFDISLLTSALSDLVTGVIGLLVSALLLHAMAKMFGGKADYWGFFSAYCFAALVIIFSVPVLLIAGMAGLAGFFIAGAFIFLNALYFFVLATIAVSNIYSISIGKSIAAIILHITVLILVAVFLALFLGLVVGFFV